MVFELLENWVYIVSPNQRYTRLDYIYSYLSAAGWTCRRRRRSQKHIFCSPLYINVLFVWWTTRSLWYDLQVSYTQHFHIQSLVRLPACAHIETRIPSMAGSNTNIRISKRASVLYLLSLCRVCELTNTYGWLSWLDWRRNIIVVAHTKTCFEIYICCLVNRAFDINAPPSSGKRESRNRFSFWLLYVCGLCLYFKIVIIISVKWVQIVQVNDTDACFRKTELNKGAMLLINWWRAFVESTDTRLNCLFVLAECYRI